MDELVVALKIDLLELRYRAYSNRDQNDGLPFTSKALRECYRQGAEAFGWGNGKSDMWVSKMAYSVLNCGARREDSGEE